eukprot:TRINITY_DN34477_c1_g1_i1.p1 TRINITY_DN34477_c1_g1~~TRINITY_DN34477_c1_g1_i1.p1  ORF type:complete len:498 (+),score=106.54 TRINITY_DN34477_c1_g1_i1:77-1570(+)
MPRGATGGPRRRRSRGSQRERCAGPQRFAAAGWEAHPWDGADDSDDAACSLGAAPVPSPPPHPRTAPSAASTPRRGSTREASGSPSALWPLSLRRGATPPPPRRSTPPRRPVAAAGTAPCRPGGSERRLMALLAPPAVLPPRLSGRSGRAPGLDALRCVEAEDARCSARWWQRLAQTPPPRARSESPPGQAAQRRRMSRGAWLRPCPDPLRTRASSPSPPRCSMITGPSAPPRPKMIEGLTVQLRGKGSHRTLVGDVSPGEQLMRWCRRLGLSEPRVLASNTSYRGFIITRRGSQAKQWDTRTSGSACLGNLGFRSGDVLKVEVDWAGAGTTEAVYRAADLSAEPRGEEWGTPQHKGRLHKPSVNSRDGEERRAAEVWARITKTKRQPAPRPEPPAPSKQQWQQHWQRMPAENSEEGPCSFRPRLCFREGSPERQPPAPEAGEQACRRLYDAALKQQVKLKGFSDELARIELERLAGFRADLAEVLRRSRESMMRNK